MTVNRRKFLTATGATVASLAIAGCTGEQNGGEAAEENETDADEPAGDTDDDFVDIEGEAGDTPNYLELTSFNAYETADNVGVFGTVKNVGDNPIEDLEVEVTLNDGDTVIGEVVDTTEQEIEVLLPGNKWQFNVTFEDENTSKATRFTVSADGDVEETDNGNGNETTTGTETASPAD